MVSNVLFRKYVLRTSEEITKAGRILGKSAPKIGKTNTTETIHLLPNVYEDDNFSRKVPGKKGYVSVKECINKNIATCKSLSNSQKLFTAFKEKHSNVNIGFSKFCS